MDWSHSITPEIPVAAILQHCTLANLPRLCTDVYQVEDIVTDGSTARTECLWGVFELECRPIRNGIRYALTSCPNAFQWTVTSRHGETVVHGSINQMTPDAEFAESIAEFLQNFRSGLQQQIHRNGNPPNEP